MSKRLHVNGTRNNAKVAGKSAGKGVKARKATAARRRNKKFSAPETRMVSREHLYQKAEPHFRVKDDREAIERYEEQYRLYKEDIGEAERLTSEDAAKDAKKRLIPLGALIVLQEKKDRYLVIDGRLRNQAAKNAGLDEMLCIVYQDPKEAFLAGLRTNVQHGVSLTREDRIKSVREIIVRMKDLSNRQIAKEIRVSRRWIDSVVEKYQLRKRGQLVQGKDGKFYPVGSKPKKAAASKPVAQTRPFDRLRKAIEAEKTTPKQRIKAYGDVVMAILKEAFVTDEHREEFRNSLLSKLKDFKKRA